MTTASAPPPPPPPEPLFVLRGHAAAVTCVQWYHARDARTRSQVILLFSGDAEGTLKIWDVTSRRCLWSHAVHEGSALLQVLVEPCTFAPPPLPPLSPPQPPSPTPSLRFITQSKQGSLGLWQLEFAASPPSATAADSVAPFELSFRTAVDSVDTCHIQPRLLAYIFTGSCTFFRSSVLEIPSSTLIVGLPAPSSTARPWDRALLLASSEAPSNLNLVWLASLERIAVVETESLTQAALDSIREGTSTDAAPTFPMPSARLSPTRQVIDEREIRVLDLRDGAGLRPYERSTGIVMCARAVLVPADDDQTEQADLQIVVGSEGGHLLVYPVDFQSTSCFSPPLASLELQKDALLGLDLVASPQDAPLEAIPSSHALRAIFRGIVGSALAQLHVFQLVFSVPSSAAKIGPHESIPALTSVHAIQLPAAGVNAVRIRRDELLWASVGWDHRVRLFSWRSFQSLGVLSFHSTAVQDLAFCPKPIEHIPAAAASSPSSATAVTSPSPSSALEKYVRQHHALPSRIATSLLSSSAALADSSTIFQDLRRSLFATVGEDRRIAIYAVYF